MNRYSPTLFLIIGISLVLSGCSASDAQDGYKITKITVEEKPTYFETKSKEYGCDGFLLEFDEEHPIIAGKKFYVTFTCIDR